MEISFRDKRVLVTAGTQGLGRSIVELYLKEGARVALCARSENSLNEIRQQFGPQVIARPVDLMDLDATQGFVSHVIDEWDGLDHVIVNPPHSVQAPVSKLTLSDWQRSYDAIYRSMFAVVETALPSLLQQDRASVVVISSLAAVEPLDIMPASSVLRGGIAAWVKLMTREYGSRGLRFNAVEPGYIATHIVREGISRTARETGRSAEEVIAGLARPIPLQRLGTPEEIAQAVYFLTSDLASYVSGVCLLVDGGLVRGV